MSLQSPSSCIGIPKSSVLHFSPNHIQTFGPHSLRKFKTNVLFGVQATNLKNNLKFVARLDRGVIVCAANSGSSGREVVKAKGKVDNGFEPVRGNAGCVTFRGLSHQSVEESQLVSAPFKPESGSLLWVLGPVVLISSLVMPLFFFGNTVEELFRNEVVAEIMTSFSSEVAFYIGLATYLGLTDRVQKPYLQFSSKRWSLITGLRGYLSSAFLTMGLKFIAPLVAVYVTWPILGLPALVSVAPFLLGCLAQYAFERHLEKRGSSCWPLVPIIFEVYRIYQLTKASNFLQKLMIATIREPVTPALIERNGAMVAMLVTFQILGAVCLWSFLTFLQRLFPSRPGYQSIALANSMISLIERVKRCLFISFQDVKTL